MRLFFEIVFSGVYSEYSWLKKEYESYYSIPKKYNELSPKEVKRIIHKYKDDLNNESTRKLNFFQKSNQRIQNLLDKKLKAFFQNDTYNELNRYGDLKLYRFYQFVVAYKKALEEYYKRFILLHLVLLFMF